MSALGCSLVLSLRAIILLSDRILYIKSYINMKLMKLYNVFSVCFKHAFQRVVCAMRSSDSMSDGCMNHVRPRGEHTRLSAYVQCSKRDRHSMPTKSRALINYNAARLSHAAKRLSVAISPAMRLSCKKMRSKNARRLAMRARTCSARPDDVTLSYEYMQRLACSVCLFEFYCDDKDKCCDLSVIHYSDEANTF